MRYSVKDTMRHDAEITETFMQKILYEGINEVSYQNLSSNDHEDIEFCKTSVRLSDGYVMEEFECDTYNKDINTKTKQHGVIMNRPDGSSIDMTERLAGVNDIEMEKFDGVYDEKRAKDNIDVIQGIMENCKDLSEEDKKAILEYIDKLRFGEDKVFYGKITSYTESKMSPMDCYNKFKGNSR